MAGRNTQQPADGFYPIDTGTAELISDGDRPGSWLLKVNGVQSSHVDQDDPLRLDFEYMRWMVALIESHWDPDTSRRGPDAKFRALHLGGGACSVARYLAAAYPNSRQVVVEIDGRLAELVRSWFDIPRAPLVKIRVGEAREVLESLTDGSRNLIIRDVFAGPYTPDELTTVEFTEHAQRVLTSGGMYMVNCGDAPNLSRAKQEMATIGSVFAHTVIVADPPMLKGRRYGNVIIAGSDVPIGDDPKLARRLLGGGVPAQLWDDARVRQFSAGAAVLRDEDGDESGDEGLSGPRTSQHRKPPRYRKPLR
ncbi:spermidine synthase [Arthrobacter castelli]|uniref:spermidine synthase n=1 Tax=Arthrobacter castelli TaxID=271431 RepID=UPI00040A5251|nr:fused MFS/spermidine synthase [Arthrobacter castelli]